MKKSFTEDDQPEIQEEIFINNAGLVLCSPFLPRLFTMLELTGDNGFKDKKSTERAVLLLQYMLFESVLFPEHLLVLNKLLCGLETGIPVDRSIKVTQREKETMEQMLNSIIQNWGKLGSTSIKGLIGSFLIRDGKLEQQEDAWYLKVEQKGYDILLDSLLWSYSPVKYAWMKKPIYVKWR